MKGHGVRQKLTVTGDGTAAKRDPRLDRAVAEYRQYAQDQADETLPRVETFVKAVKAGDVAAAKKAYAVSRLGWERTEPVAESFGDIDPKVDVREDGLEDGQKWTGWHRLEKALWQDGKIGAEEKTLADQLVTDLKDWQKRVARPRSPPPPWPTAPRSSSTRSPPARSPARRTATRTPTWSTSRATSRAPEGLRAAQAGGREERPGADR